MTTTDTFLILATFIGPIAAVQAQKWIERSRETRNRKLWIFHTLMSTRALRASSPEHVQALNSIDLTFDGTKKGEKPIIDAWGEYLDHLNHYPADNTDAKAIQTWNTKGEDFLIELLKKIGFRLGYSFTSVQLKRGIYYPRGHSDLISSQIALRDMIVKLSSGTWHFPMAVREFPVSDDALKLQAAVQKALLETLSGKNSIKIAINEQQRAELPQ